MCYQLNSRQSAGCGTANAARRRGRVLAGGAATTLAALLLWIVASWPVVAWGQAEAGLLGTHPLGKVGGAAEQPTHELDLSPLAPHEQLVLIISTSTDRHGQQSRVLVFLYRTKLGGWEAVGTHDTSELRRHWLSVAERRMPWVNLSPQAAESSKESNQESTEHRKLRLSVELSIHQFIRAYEQLRTELAEDLKSDKPTRELLQSAKVTQLRGLGVNGIFHRDSLPAKLIGVAAGD